MDARTRRRLVPLLPLIILTISPYAHAQPCLDYSSYLHVKGYTAPQPPGYELVAVSSHGNTVVTLSAESATEGLLSFYDSSDADDLVELAAFPITVFEYCEFCSFMDLYFFGDYVYVFSGGSAFLQGGIDIYHWDPVGTLTFVDWLSTSLLEDYEIEGDRLYYTWVQQYGPPHSRLIVHDISDPASPQWLGETAFTEEYGFFRDLEAVGQTVFVVGDGLIALDASDPAAAVLLDHMAELPAGGSLAISGDVAFVDGNRDNNLHVVDISDPSDLTLLFSGYGLSDYHTYFELIGDRLFQTFGSSDYYGANVYDISTPESPVLLGKIGSGSSKPRLHGTPEAIYMIDGTGDLGVLGPPASDPAPYRAQLDILDGLTVFVSARDDLVIAPSWWSGSSVIVDASDPENPLIIGQLPYHCHDAAFAGDLAYVASTEFLVLDFSDPSTPELLSSLPVYGRSLDLVGNIAYVADYDGLSIIDVSDPEQPELLGPGVPGQYLQDVRVHDGYAYLGSQLDSGLLVYDVSDPQAPTFVATNLIDSGYALDLDWPYLYVGRYWGWLDNLVVLDISDPLDLQIVATLTLPGPNIENLDVKDDRLYVANDFAGLCVVDISDPHAPTLDGGLAIPEVEIGNGGHRTVGVAIGESALFLAERDGGLGIAWLDCSGVTAIADPAPAAGMSLDLYPNPFNPQVTIAFELPWTADLHLEIYDAAGRRVDRIAAGAFPAGLHRLNWTAEDGAGRPLASGVYLLRLGSDAGELVTVKAVLLR